MSMKIARAAGYITTILLGSFCPMQMAGAMPMPEPMQHAEMTEIAMTPMVLMTPVAPMSVAPARYATHSIPVFPSGNCTTGHCIMMRHAEQQNATVSIVSIQLVGSTAQSVGFPPVPALADLSPAPPLSVGSATLAQTITTIVLRV